MKVETLAISTFTSALLWIAMIAILRTLAQ